MFVQLQDALNRVWDVTPKPGAIFTSLLRKRLLSFAVVLGLGFLLAVSLVLFTAVAALSEYLETKLQFPAKLLGTTTIVVSFLVITLLFAMIYKVLPDVRLSWRDVALGSVVTALLFEIGKALIGFYLGHTGLASVYGAAGSLVLLLSWVYYSAMIFLLGAEFTRVYSRRFHHAEVTPEKGAQKVKQIEIVAPAQAPAGGDRVSRDPMRSAR
jgi:membrane protein